MHMVSVLLSDIARPYMPKTSTKTAVPKQLSQLSVCHLSCRFSRVYVPLLFPFWMESTLYVFLPDSVFLPCYHGLDFQSLCNKGILHGGLSRGCYKAHLFTLTNICLAKSVNVTVSANLIIS